MLEHIEMINNNPAIPAAVEAIHNFYKLSIIGHAVRYLHLAAMLPTKAPRIKSIHNWNYLT